ncbi:3,4-dihydroxy-2-butanone-4-phosphate synthase [archaeon]|nr:3,4-dihydroxy-2-butanone-4-phosphate synthase [archaeon]
MPSTVSEAIEALRAGQFIMVYDFADREAEVDLMIGAEFVEPHHIAFLRQYGGGLICVAVSYEVGLLLDLPYIEDLYRCVINEYPLLEKLAREPAPYGKPTFSITVNARTTYTGITDTDRATTVQELGVFLRNVFLLHRFRTAERARREFALRFRSPGHVPILIATRGELVNRQGHTEIAVYLAKQARIAPAVCLCECLDGETFQALSLEKAERFAADHNIPLITGDQVLEHAGIEYAAPPRTRR